ncbi:MAG: hypothetical protein U0V75_12740 [Ferruginibacter sp.]
MPHPKKRIKIILQGLFFCILLQGCTIESTNYYPDGQEDGLAIFSNTGNNLMTAYANNIPWQTRPRSVTVVLSSVKRYEVMLRKYNFNGIKDTLELLWTGDQSANGNSTGDLGLSMIFPKGFGYRDFNALQGKRLAVDLNNGYFTATIGNLNAGNVKGIGMVYFHTAALDSTGPGIYSGKISGLIEADFNGNKITKGRFDHTINSDQVFFR